MKILSYVDLGKSFEKLKNKLIEIEKEAHKETSTVQETGEKYARAYGRLSAVVQGHISANTDTDYGFLQEALKGAENGSDEAPTLLRYDHNPDDLPVGLFESPKTFKP